MLLFLNNQAPDDEAFLNFSFNPIAFRKAKTSLRVLAILSAIGLRLIQWEKKAKMKIVVCFPGNCTYLP